ncbi:MAG: 2-oxoglutarate dehydrogenase E1 component, partial [Chloroflexi bacterium]|nr:2-oxoglutarate dehydrogenase E1 component [Chloroflexota bacterium]
ALALGSILNDGHDIRLTGQDVRRGTFSHRHAALIDYETGVPWVALDGYSKSHFWINNSPLSEVATVSFEQGYSVASSRSLVVWEAQFGDFVNNAQSVIDEMIVSARDKWNQESGLVMLLPHGYEGQGPNHSHAHIERFLALAAKNNIRIAYPTTAAQYFHLLRSQAAMLEEQPLPLVVMTGKSLLRHPLAAANARQLSSGGFKPVIRYQKPGIKLEDVSRVVLCTGKVFVDVVSHPDFENANNLSIIRFEELYPFPAQNLERELKKLPNVSEYIWLQEEPQNRGAWSFMRPRLLRSLPEDASIRYVGRPATPSPAEGSHWLHKMQQEHLAKVAIGTEEAVSAFV